MAPLKSILFSFPTPVAQEVPVLAVPCPVVLSSVVPSPEDPRLVAPQVVAESNEFSVLPVMANAAVSVFPVILGSPHPPYPPWSPATPAPKNVNHTQKVNVIHTSPCAADYLTQTLCFCSLFRLAGCNLTDECCESVASALESSNSLIELDLSYNYLKDTGVKLLSTGLKSPHCKLEILRLSDCKVKEEGCSSLASGLSMNPSHLKELDLSYNHPGDSGMNLLSALLEDPHCRLEKLKLCDCVVKEEGCSYLGSALRSNPSSLTELDLSYNRLGASGVKLLSALLEDPHCRLEKLKLTDCKLTDECCESVASALGSSNSPLIELDLSYNYLQDSGVKLLSAGLKSPHCKLEILRSSWCNVAEEGCSYLASALRSNPSHLRQLDLSYNHPGVSGVKLLSAVLEDPHCRLEKLKLTGCYLTDECCESVASALESSTSLIELDLSYNQMQDSAINLLSSGLKSPNCKLKILRLCDCMVKEESCSNVVSSLRSNSSHLRVLDLSHKGLSVRVEAALCFCGRSTLQTGET